MSITRSQIARELMAEGGAPRQGYFLGKIVRKIKDDIIPNELKSPAGAAAAAALGSYGIGRMGEGGADRSILENILKGGSTAVGKTRNVLFGDPEDDDSKGIIGGAVEAITKPRFPVKDSDDKQSIGGRLLSGILSPTGLSIGAGLLAGAFAKDKEDPSYTGQSVGLNLRDIRKLANISDPRTGSAIGLNFLPETRFRQFTPEQMAETYATTTPVEFTEQRESAEDGGIMGNQEDFNKFLEDMKKRDYGRMREQILRDYEKYMRRKRMINQMPEAKDGGIMKEFKMASNLENEEVLESLFEKYLDMGLSPKDAADKARQEFEKMSKAKKSDRMTANEGGLMNLGGMEMDLRGGGFVPIGAKERADDVPARLSKNEFVFTADAVRAAGGGSVDKGADKMYATMKALENKVA